MSEQPERWQIAFIARRWWNLMVLQAGFDQLAGWQDSLFPRLDLEV